MVFYNKTVLKNFAIFAEKHQCWRLQHRCFPLNVANFLGTPILKNNLRTTDSVHGKKWCISFNYYSPRTSIQPLSQKLMYTDGRENQMRREVMQNLIEGTKRTQMYNNAQMKWYSNRCSSYFKDKKIKMELKSEKKTESWNDKLKKQDDIFSRYCRNKRVINITKERESTLPRKFQIKQRETEKQVKNTKFEANFQMVAFYSNFWLVNFCDSSIYIISE